MTNVNAVSNDFFTVNDFINGVFLLFNVQVLLECTKMCKFWFNLNRYSMDVIQN